MLITILTLHLWEVDLHAFVVFVILKLFILEQAVFSLVGLLRQEGLLCKQEVMELLCNSSNKALQSQPLSNAHDARVSSRLLYIVVFFLNTII